MTTSANESVELTVASAADSMGDRARPLDWIISRRILRAMLHYRRLFVGIMVLAVGIAVLNGALPHIAGLVIAGPVIEHASFEAEMGMSARTGVLLGAGIILVMAVLWVIIMRSRFIAVAVMAERVAHDLRTRLFDHLHLLSMDFFDRTKVGWIIARGSGDIDQVRNAVSQVIPRTLISLLQMVYAMIAIGLYDMVMLGILALIAPVVYLINHRFRVLLSIAHRATRASFSRLTANLAESVSGVRVTQAFAREDVNAAIFRQLCLDHRSNHLREARAQGVYVPTLDLAGQIFIVIALLLGGWRVERGAMSVGDLIGIMLMTRAFFSPITVMGEMYNLTMQAMAGGERIFRLLDTRPTITEPLEPVTLPCTDQGARIEFANLTFAYTPGQPVLHDVSFTAQPGQTLAIVGSTGAGKTTIASLIAKFYQATQGRILVDGISLADIHSDDLHAQMAMVQQSNFLFQGSVRDNIRMGRPSASDAEVEDVARHLECLDLLSALPGGLDAQVGERGESLSLGQRQLVCFARALIAQPRILLLDEATSAVDAVTEHRVQQSLAKLLQGRTSIVIAHRLSTIRHAHHVLVIEHGRIIEQGNHATLIAHNGRYAELYEQFIRHSRGE
ncbi:MAG: ABC transporter ATP-binding protein [Phycisphaerales bacterium]